jgi:hypothetical protein
LEAEAHDLAPFVNGRAGNNITIYLGLELLNCLRACKDDFAGAAF